VYSASWGVCWINPEFGSLVAVAYFLPGRAKDLSAPPRIHVAPSKSLLKSSSMWDVTQRSLVVSYRCFGAISRSHLLLFAHLDLK
jgi:hypothetical protein